MSDELALIEKPDRIATDAAEGPRALTETREPRFSDQ
jgi:hypothetical protein